MRFKIGDPVKIKTGVKLRGMKLDISSWQGRVGVSEHKDSELILVELDSLVMKSWPEDYVIETLRETGEEALNHFYMKADDLAASTERDSLEDVENTIEALCYKYEWQAFSDGSPAKELIVEVVEREDDWVDWVGYLEENLTFPFKAQIDPYQDGGAIPPGSEVKVHRLEDQDDHYGIIAEVRLGRKKYFFPLCGMEVVDQNSPNAIAVEAYRIWFANS